MNGKAGNNPLPCGGTGASANAGRLECGPRRIVATWADDGSNR